MALGGGAGKASAACFAATRSDLADTIHPDLEKRAPLRDVSAGGSFPRRKAAEKHQHVFGFLPFGEAVVQTANETARRRLARATAWPMFCLSVAFLALVAALIVLWVDVPRVIVSRQQLDGGVSDELTALLAAEQTADVRAAMAVGTRCLWVLLALWPIFWLEFLAQFVLRDRRRPFWRRHYDGLIVCLCPPLRLNARHPDLDGKVWLPLLGWQAVDGALRQRLERAFGAPMIFIALGILPVLLVEFGMSDLVAAQPWLQTLLHVSMGLIWFAFAVEFIIMVSVAENKLRYCKEHWLDLAIILLPLVSFLRSLRLVRATRLARVAKLQQLSKMGRLYRLRGLTMRALRAMLVFGLLNRLLRVRPEKRLRQLRRQVQEKESEIAALHRLITDLEQQIEAARAPAAQGHGKRP
jgi:hypothetical protein